MITKQTTTLENINFLAGESLLIDKPFGWSSFKVIHQLRRIIKIKKIGHAGTLDPLATGLLIICTGKKTKEITLYQDMPKTYQGTFTIGKKTTTMDAEGEVTEEKDFSYVTEELIKETVGNFLGEIEQLPPMYSAVNYKGKKLYEYARAGKEVVRQPRKITIFSFTIDLFELPFVKFTIKCTKGTYIRVIAEDFGNSLGCGAFLSDLRRTQIGDFNVDDSFEPWQFRKLYSGESIT